MLIVSVIKWNHYQQHDGVLLVCVFKSFSRLARLEMHLRDQYLITSKYVQCI